MRRWELSACALNLEVSIDIVTLSSLPGSMLLIMIRAGWKAADLWGVNNRD